MSGLPVAIRVVRPGTSLGCYDSAIDQRWLLFLASPPAEWPLLAPGRVHGPHRLTGTIAGGLGTRGPACELAHICGTRVASDIRHPRLHVSTAESELTSPESVSEPSDYTEGCGGFLGGLLVGPRHPEEFGGATDSGPCPCTLVLHPHPSKNNLQCWSS
jgi:hypothetical protein